ncbi:hypothetical protein Barb6XT_00400 [Bacteroidales bacterium Barb6XT]|nr:hypothetical protein Barb6XT_00400 [Bacteroidales bacterium Barb6XT]
MLNNLIQFKMKKILFLLVALLSLSSCDKDDDVFVPTDESAEAPDEKTREGKIKFDYKGKSYTYEGTWNAEYHTEFINSAWVQINEKIILWEWEKNAAYNEKQHLRNIGIDAKLDEYFGASFPWNYYQVIIKLADHPGIVVTEYRTR